MYIAGRDANDYPVSESFILQGIVNPDNTVTAATITTTNFTQHRASKIAFMQSQLRARSQLPPPRRSLFYADRALSACFLWCRWFSAECLRTRRVGLNDLCNNEIACGSVVWDALMNFATAALWKRLQQLRKPE